MKIIEKTLKNPQKCPKTRKFDRWGTFNRCIFRLECGRMSSKGYPKSSKKKDFFSRNFREFCRKFAEFSPKYPPKPPFYRHFIKAIASIMSNTITYKVNNKQ